MRSSYRQQGAGALVVIKIIYLFIYLFGPLCHDDLMSVSPDTSVLRIVGCFGL
ncbi:hypothetical protein OENI_1350001 [Oenococcus oeni]|nr:hypothetical protein OENI_1350001 [Oenococcus oeni]